MDVLSDVIALMRTGRPRAARVEWRAPWGQRFPALPGSAGFQVVLEGAGRLLPQEGEPIALSAGDVLFFPRGHGYAMADTVSTPLAEPACDPLAEELGLFAADSSGGAGAATVLLCGGYRFDVSRAHPLLADLPDLVHLQGALGRDAELSAAIGLLSTEVQRPGGGADTIVTSLLDMLLLYILRACFATEPGHCRVGGWAAALADPGISAVLDAVHRDPAHPWTVQEMGERAGLSRSAFARRFTALVRQPPLTYLTWWRLAMAARLMRESDAVLGEIAARVGYSSEFAFSNAFKREHGMSPGRYRRDVGRFAPPRGPRDRRTASRRTHDVIKT
ncbi:AraC family transcriptional regulator [Nonomuraea diastatica]|uniref:AraC family transcriptional regulator n=1 Tax=Nonomuraea diastatica TaxID=1848329 RepID=A0A4R4WAY6_9ACTN|nr:AraC family transcriptional regulator [Nonomuraea diastatica]TDD15949.1 AraC family transcriptional regulator [Nonomuraea diastatica]